MKQISSVNEWLYTNLDLIEECKEKKIKPVVLVGGASSSGKSYTSNLLKEFLDMHKLKSVVISTDSYNKGIARNIFDIVDRKYYNSTLSNRTKVISNIKEIIINTDFDQKFSPSNLSKIDEKCKDLLKVDMQIFLDRLKYEFDHINFDQKCIYDLEEVGNDIDLLNQNKKVNIKEYSKRISERLPSQEFFDGNQIDVIIIEGIYALDNALTKNLDKKTLIKNFVDCNNKNLFLRRMIRDTKITDCPTSFILKNYLDFVAPEYINNVLPNKETCDIVLKNNMTFEELRQGKLTYQQKYEVSKNTLFKILEKAQIIKKYYQQDIYFGDKNDENILRLRLEGNSKDNLQIKSLTYKGKPKYRQDKKLIRPVQTFASGEDLKKVYKNAQEIIAAFDKAGINVLKTINKTRSELIFENEKISLDALNGKYYLEIDNIKNPRLLSLLTGSPKAKEFVKEV